MRRSAPWQTIWDDRILEILNAEGAMPVKKIEEHENILVSDATVSRRLQKLADNNLVIPLGNGVYQISDEGKAYLRGEYNADRGVYLNGESDESTQPSPSETSESGGSNGAT